jgi:3-oxoadipate enol-lactonase
LQVSQALCHRANHLSSLPITGDFAMPFVDLNGARFHYQMNGKRGSPALVLSNSLGSALSMWDPQVEAFGKHFCVVRYDQRGHGQSAVTPGPYPTAQLGGDVVALMDALEIEHANFLGLSMGGAAGQWLATNHPKRVDKLVLSNTAAKFGSAQVWDERIATARDKGLSALVDGTLERWFTAGFRAKAPQVVAGIRQAFLATPQAGFVACCQGLRENDQQESIRTIRTPTLVIAGTHDPGTPPAAGKLIAERIPGAKYVELDAAHLANLEAPEAYNETVLDFLLS